MNGPLIVLRTRAEPAITIPFFEVDEDPPVEGGKSAQMLLKTEVSHPEKGLLAVNFGADWCIACKAVPRTEPNSTWETL